MPATYQAESFYRAKISTSIAAAQSVPITVRLSKLPSRTSGLLTISPNTENEEIVEYANPNVGNMTVDIIKRGVNPASGLLTTAGTDYNNPAFQRDHAQNEIIRGDVNHIHINQGVANTVLASNTTVGISKLSIAAADPNDPIVVGTNDPRLSEKASTSVAGKTKLSVAPVDANNPIAVGTNDPRLTPTDSSTTTKGVVKLSVAPVDANNPIAVGDNDPRLGVRIEQGSGSFTPSTGTETVTLGWRPKRIRMVAVNINNQNWGRSDAHIFEDGTSTTKVNVQFNYAQEQANMPTVIKNTIYINNSNTYAICLRWEVNSSVAICTRPVTITATGFTIGVPNYMNSSDTMRYYWEAIG